MNASRVKLFELREYVSDRSGATYFSGYLGNARVLVLRDDRAECTGREKARWSVLLEEQPPRDARAPAKEAKATGASPAPSVAAPSRAGKKAPQRRGGSAVERHAETMLRERGIDPTADMPSDELPF